MTRSKQPADNDATRWRREALRYRPTGDAIIALGSKTCLDYLAAVGCLRYVAQHGVTRRELNMLDRPDQYGRRRGSYSAKGQMEASITNLGGRSAPPKYDEIAMRKIEAEEAWMRCRLDALIAWLDEHVGERNEPVVAVTDA